MNYQTDRCLTNLTRNFKHALTYIKDKFIHYKENELKRQKIICKLFDEKSYIAEVQSSNQEKDLDILMKKNKLSYEKT